MSASKTSGPFLLSVETREMPGKAILRFVKFETEIVDLNDDFNDRTFNLFDPALPEYRALQKVICDK